MQFSSKALYSKLLKHNQAQAFGPWKKKKKREFGTHTALKTELNAD